MTASPGGWGVGEEEFETNHPSWNARDRAGRQKHKLGTYLLLSACLFVIAFIVSLRF